jgi:RNA polymerase sigma-70 factor (ECF subfamily)
VIEYDTVENLSEIIQKAQKGDKNAYGLLYKEYFQRIYRYCKVNIFRSDLAEDITQETFIRAWKALPKFKQTETGTFQAYLFRIARNLIIDLSRKKKEFTLEQYQEIEIEEDIAGQIDKKDELTKVKSALAHLDDIDRQIVVLRYFEEMSHKECATIIGIKEGALRVRTIRVLKKIKNIIENYG